jgi:uncharacterized caspase-like protein
LAKRVALVVGNGAYANAPALPNPANDAKAIAAELEKLGFEVQLALDVNQDQGLDALDKFAAALPGAEAAVFFYSGHGMQIDGNNFLLPIDVEASSERSVRYGSIDISEVVHDMETNAPVAIIVLDACRDNPFAAQLQQSTPRSRSAAPTRGLAVIKPSGNGSIIAFAAAEGATASDGDTEHSPYTAALLKHMNEPNVEVGLMFSRVAGDVDTATNGEQKPEVLIRLTREFYMKEEAVAVEQVVVTQAEQAVATIESPPAPTTGVDAARTPVVPAYPPVEKAAEPRLPGEQGPYAELLARLDLDPPIYVPPAAWAPPPKGSYAEIEPNSSFGSANSVNVNTAIDLSIEQPGDGDYFYFNTGAAGVLAFYTGNQPPELDLVIRMLNAEGQDITGWVATPRPGGVLEGWFDVPAPGAYWLEVRDNYNDAASPARVALELSFAPQEDPYEPNNAPSLARVLPLEGSHRLNIQPLAEVDYFILPVKSPGELSVRATGVPEELDIAMQLLDYDLAGLSGWVVAPRPGGDTDALFRIGTPGLYVLEVRDNYNDKRSGKAFTLETKFTPSPDPFEPNENITTARWLPLSEKHQLNIFPIADADWFRIEVDHPGELLVDALTVPENLDVTLRALTPEQRDLTGWIAPPRPGGDTVGSVDLAQPGVYYLEVRDSGNDQTSVKPFTFRTRFTSSPDQYEPNDTARAATPLRANGEVVLNILPLGDADWFKVQIEEPGELAVSIDEGPENLDLTYHVLDSDRRDMTGWVPAYAKGGLTEGFVDLARAGQYFIEVRDGNNDGRSIKPAVLTTRFTPTTMSYEPNDTFGTATQVSLVGSNADYILPKGDGDWHVFYAPGPGMLNVSVDEVPEVLDVALRVLDSDQRDLTGWIIPPRPGGETTGTVKLERPGWYWMEIRDSYNDARSPKPFRVTRTFTPAG